MNSELKLRLRRGNAALRKLAHILPPNQAAAVRQLFRGEEGEYYADLMTALAIDVEDTPVTYQTDGQGDSAAVHLHYFCSGSDWWITELDSAAPEADGHHQAFGFVCLNGWTDSAESGYISLPELFKELPHLNLDFHWEKTPLWKIKKQLGIRYRCPDDDAEEKIAERSATPPPGNVIHLPTKRPIPSDFL